MESHSFCDCVQMLVKKIGGRGVKAEPASDEEPEPDRPPKRSRSASSLALEQPTPPLAIPASPEEITSHLVEQARLGDLADTMSSVKATTYHCWPPTPNTELQPRQPTHMDNLVKVTRELQRTAAPPDVAAKLQLDVRGMSFPLVE